jgi:formimidoylglutamate deiminase
MTNKSNLWFEEALLPSGWARNVAIAVSDGRIEAVRTQIDPGPADDRYGVALPGLSNVHSHAFQRGMAGLAETRGPAGDDFWTWREVMYRFLDRLGPADVEAIAAQAYMEMLEAGFTRVGEFHYLHHDIDGGRYTNVGELAERIAAAADLTGIGLTLLPVFYAHSGFGGADPKPAQRRFLSNRDLFSQLLDASHRAVASLPGANVGVAPHSLRAVTADELEAVVGLAVDGPIHIHAAEQLKEVEDCIRWSGLRPVRWLLEHMRVDQKWCLIHATHLTVDETQRLASSGAVAGLCPTTEANLGDGVFPAKEFLASGGVFGIGTDSNVLIETAGELRGLEYSQRLTLRERNVLGPSEGDSIGGALFRSASTGGAQALGAPHLGLRAGAPADIVTLDREHPSLIGRQGDALLDAWIFAGGGKLVETVWRNGNRVVEQGRHRKHREVTSHYRTVVKALLSG